MAYKSQSNQTLTINVGHLDKNGNEKQEEHELELARYQSDGVMLASSKLETANHDGH